MSPSPGWRLSTATPTRVLWSVWMWQPGFLGPRCDEPYVEHSSKLITLLPSTGTGHCRSQDLGLAGFEEVFTGLRLWRAAGWTESLPGLLDLRDRCPTSYVPHRIQKRLSVFWSIVELHADVFLASSLQNGPFLGALL